ncbi:MAG TPA: hypothetical protein VGQ55_06220, partial [Pyrinomonadaceae bacterium]|nr:hypothetical protein [Pyrinomonadaceae bacterium]
MMVKSYDAFDHLCDDAFPDNLRRGLIAVLTVYFDATEAPNPNPNSPLVHTVGAYVATRSNWKRFRREWKRELDMKNLEYFHLTDFEYAN